MSSQGMCCSCIAFIPKNSLLEASLRAITHRQSLTAHDSDLENRGRKAFVDIHFGILDPLRPFTQTVVKMEDDIMKSLLQEFGGKLRPATYFSANLAVADFQAFNSLSVSCNSSRKSTSSFQRYCWLFLVNHFGFTYCCNDLLDQKMSHLSTAKLFRYKTTLLEMPNITVKRCTQLCVLFCTPVDGVERWFITNKTSSDNGTPFVSGALKQIVVLI